MGKFSASLQALCWIFNTTQSKAIKTLTILCSEKIIVVKQHKSNTKMWLFGCNLFLFSQQCQVSMGSIYQRLLLLHLLHSFLWHLPGLLHGKEPRIHRSAWRSAPLVCFISGCFGIVTVDDCSRPASEHQDGKQAMASTYTSLLFWMGCFSTGLLLGKSLPVQFNIALPLFTHVNTEKHDL